MGTVLLLAVVRAFLKCANYFSEKDQHIAKVLGDVLVRLLYLSPIIVKVVSLRQIDGNCATQVFI